MPSASKDNLRASVPLETPSAYLTPQYLEQADKLADRGAVIDHGKVIAEGTADELKSKVGKDRLELIVEKQENLNKAAVSITGDVLIREADRSLSVPIDNVGDVRRVLEKLDQAGIGIESLSLHKPTLDDVFLQLTGKQAETKPEEAAAPLPR